MSDMPNEATPEALGNATEGATQKAAEEMLPKSVIEAIIKERLKEQAEALEKKRKMEQMSEIERLQAELAEVRKKAEQSDLQALRLQVAAQKGIPATSAGRLVGTTLEALLADADLYLSDLKAVSKPTPPDLDGAAGVGQRGNGTSLSSEEMALALKAGMTPDQWLKAKQRTVKR